MSNFNLINNPVKIYIVFFVAFILFSLVGIPILSIGYSDGEQRPLTLLMYAGDILILSYFILSIITSYIFMKWFRTYWFINLLIMAITGYLLISTYVLPRLT